MKNHDKMGVYGNVKIALKVLKTSVEKDER